MKIEMKKVRNMSLFDAKEFCVKPRYWGLESFPIYKAPEMLAEAQKMAENIDEICIAIVHDDFFDSALVNNSSKFGMSKFILFNATETERVNAEVRAISFSAKRGVLSTKYWFDQWIKFQKGSIV